MTADSRQSPIAIAWTDDGLIGRLTIDGELWAAVEWSEKRQRWCIEDAEGQCLRHTASIRGAAESKEAAVALAEAMIRDGRMPTPKEAKSQAAERRDRARGKARTATSGNPKARRGRTLHRHDAECVQLEIQGGRSAAAL